MNTIALPPLFDHHSHYSMYAVLSALPSLAEINDHAHACDVIHSTDSGDINVLLGWNTSKYSLVPADLGQDKPVIVLNLSLHGMVMNAAAEEYLSRNNFSDLALNHADPLWTENNLSKILGMMVSLAPLSTEQIVSFGWRLLEQGIGAMEDMLLPGSRWLGMARDLPIHVDFWADETVYSALTSDERKMVKGIKLFTDGALGTRTAAVHGQYLSGESGLLLHGDEALRAKMYTYMKQGIPLAIHAIGGRAVDQVVGSACSLRKEPGCSGQVRIEHAQFITQGTAFSARESGIVLCMQPNFSLDSIMYADRFSAVELAANNPFRMLIDSAGFVPGVDLLFGSDGMPHGMVPALESSLYPPYPDQQLTLDEFRSGYCMKDSENEYWLYLDGKHAEIVG